MSESTSLMSTGFVNEKKQFPRQQAAFVVDGLATVCGSLMGTSPIATYIESAAGIREGGRTGLTALTCAFYFFVALFFVPVLCEPSSCRLFLRFATMRVPKSPNFGRSAGAWPSLETFSAALSSEAMPPCVPLLPHSWPIQLLGWGLASCVRMCTLLWCRQCSNLFVLIFTVCNVLTRWWSLHAANIPPYAVGGALLIVGALMVANVAKIPWDRIGQVSGQI